MSTLWENFSLFEPREWLQELSNVSGVVVDHTNTMRCDWSYGFRENSTRKIADIVIGFERKGMGLGCYVIEAKRPGGKLGTKDLDPDYYLSIEAIRNGTTSKNLIYCVDAREKRHVLELILTEPNKYAGCGAISWEEVGGIQVRLAQNLRVPEKMRSFIAGAIQYQYCQHDIVPSTLAQSYLEAEPNVDDVFSGIKTPYDNHDPQWMLQVDDVT